MDDPVKHVASLPASHARRVGHELNGFALRLALADQEGLATCLGVGSLNRLAETRSQNVARHFARGASLTAGFLRESSGDGPRDMKRQDMGRTTG